MLSKNTTDPRPVLEAFNAAVLASLPWALAVVAFVAFVLPSPAYVFVPTLPPASIAIAAVSFGHASLVAATAGTLGLLAAAALGARMAGSRLSRSTSYALALVAAPVTLIGALALLWLNVSVLKYRYSMTSLVVDAAVMLVAGACIVLGTLALRRRVAPPARLRSAALAAAALLLLAVPMSLPPLDLGSGAAEAEQTPQAPAASATADVAANASPRWNVVLVSLDTLRPDHLGAYGYERPVSPHLDALAANAVTFDNAYSQAPWTLPAHGSILTGQYPTAHGAMLSPVFARQIERMPQDRVTLAEVLKDAGYATASFTASDLLGAPYGFDQGFDTSDYHDRGRGMSDRWAKGREWLAGVGAQPYFLFLHSYDVHNYNPPEEEKSRFVRPYSGPLLDLHRAGRRGEKLRHYVVSSGFFSLTGDDLRFLIDLYDATIAAVDVTMGEIFAALKARGDWDRTIVIVTSDHGEEFFEHGGTGHGFTLYEEQLRVPLLLRYPGCDEGRRVSTRVRHVDVVPTVLELLRLPVPEQVQGESTVELMRGGEEPHRTVFAEGSHIGNNAAVIVQSDKLIRTRYVSSKTFSPANFVHVLRQVLTRKPDRLFDLSSDPEELAPASGDDAAGRERLLATLDEIRADSSARASRERADRSEMDGATTERLRALGYIQ